MRTRGLAFALYMDAEGLERVQGLIADAVEASSARVVGMSAVPADGYGFLAQQWDVEHPGRSRGARRPVELRVRLACSLRTRRELRKALIATLCPAGQAEHVCPAPWMAL
ncbi:hypothetical protein [Streptomyces sp. NPDC029003]|uniref:hypothetical protein n=1 Tax=Streptomyces sp. NPDC029003 TaxID=3155125 RepID=UPI0033EE58BD